MQQLGALDFGSRIIIFGASLLLSVLPIIILLGALASTRVDDDVSRHLGLNAHGSRIIRGLFRSSSLSFNLGILVALLLSLAGTIAVAGLVQAVYERAFDLTHHRGAPNLLRLFTWVIGLAAFLVVDAEIAPTLRHGPAGPVVLGVVDLVLLTLFFWWTMHFLVAGRVPWHDLRSSAIATAIFWIGLGVFASFYFSSTVVSDSKLYGTIGVVFTLASWFIAMGAVIILGAAVGLVWERQHPATERPE
jgi:membrane protein